MLPVLRSYVALFLLCVGLASSASAQSESGLSVTVRDNDGVLVGAVVTATAQPAGRTIRAVTNDRGVASFPTLASGTYDLQVSFPGFSDVEERVTVNASGVTTLDVVLRLLRLSESTTVVTAARRAQALADVADPTVVIDATTISDTGSRTAKDLLAEYMGSGVQVQTGGGQGHVSINGIPNSGVLVLVDGKRYLGKDANGSFNLEDLLLTNVERVEVVKGAGSALYGSDAIGGVINFVTKQTKAAGFSSSTEINGGSYADWRVNQSVTWRGTRGGIRAGGGYRTYDGFDLSESNPQTIGQPASTWKTTELSGDVQLTDVITFSLTSDYMRRDITNYFFAGATQLASSVYDSQRQLTRWSVSPSIDVVVSPQTSFNATFTSGRYDRDETRIFVVSGAVTPQAPWKEWNDEVRLVGRHAFQGGGEDHLFQAGFEHRREKLRRGTLTIADPSRSIDVAWLQQEVVLAGDKIRVTGGVRFDRYSDFGNETSPKVSLVYAPAAKHRVRTSWGHGFRPPMFGELYLNTPPSFVGNPDLKPETANTFDIGYSYVSPYAEVTVDYFDARVANGITFDLSTSPFTYGNISKYRSRGTNVTASVPLPGGFVPGISYNFNERLDANGNEIGGYSRHSTYLKLLWAHPRLGLRANVRGQLLGDVPPATDGSYQPGYEVWNAQVSKKIATRRGQALSLYVQATNLGDTRDIYLRTAAGEPVLDRPLQIWIAPRTFQAGLTLDMDWTR